jgi:hypothetical protein
MVDLLSGKNLQSNKKRELDPWELPEPSPEDEKRVVAMINNGEEEVESEFV